MFVIINVPAPVPVIVNVLVPEVAVISAPAIPAAVLISIAIWAAVATGYPEYVESAVCGFTLNVVPLGDVIENSAGAEG